MYYIVVCQGGSKQKQKQAKVGKVFALQIVAISLVQCTCIGEFADNLENSQVRQVWTEGTPSSYLPASGKQCLWPIKAIAEMVRGSALQDEMLLN